MRFLTHLDLFSGIGGFAIAAQACGFRTVAFCEIEPYAQQVLKEKFGAVLANAAVGGFQEQGLRHQNVKPSRLRSGNGPLLHPDIFTLNGADYLGVDLITGGFPCQPYSLAGKRRGAADDRAIWREMRRIIAEARPAWVLGENVPGIIGMELDRVLSDLEALGYACWPLVIPACAVDARHRRDRVWIVGHASGERIQGFGTSGKQVSFPHDGTGLPMRPGEDVANPTRKQNGRLQQQRIQPDIGTAGDGIGKASVWLPEPDVGGTLDGLPTWLDANKGLTMESHKLLSAYGKTANQSPAEVLQILRSGIEAGILRRQAGGSGRVSSEAVLLAYLCQLQAQTGTLGNLSLEGEKAPGRDVRGLRDSDQPPSPPHRPRPQKQQGVKHPDSLHSLSSVLAFHAEQAWGAYRFQNAQNVLVGWREGWEDGFRRIASGIPNRAHRLRALGNAIVPAVAYQILKPIAEMLDNENLHKM